MRNLLTDIAGVRVGNAHDAQLMSGVTAVLFDQPAVASVAVVGGAPAGRDLSCLQPGGLVGGIDAIVLSGGSGFGLDAASGAQAWLRAQNRGFPVGPMKVPIVPSAVCFDLLNGGDKDWGRFAPYRELGYSACQAAQAEGFALGSVGAGMGASTADLKGGLGSASAVTIAGIRVAALVIVNALGSALIGEGPQFWAGPLEQGDEFGGLAPPTGWPSAQRQQPSWKGQHVPRPSTTLACIATDADLSIAQVHRTAISASAGLARGLRLSHALMDGDTVFAVSTGRQALADPLHDLIALQASAADCLARAIARAVYLADIPGPAWQGPPAWRQRFGQHSAGTRSPHGPIG